MSKLKSHSRTFLLEFDDELEDRPWRELGGAMLLPWSVRKQLASTMNKRSKKISNQYIDSIAEFLNVYLAFIYFVI